MAIRITIAACLCFICGLFLNTTLLLPIGIFIFIFGLSLNARNNIILPIFFVLGGLNSLRINNSFLFYYCDAKVIYSTESFLVLRNYNPNRFLVKIRKPEQTFVPGKKIRYGGLFKNKTCIRFKKIKEYEGLVELSLLEKIRINLREFCLNFRNSGFVINVFLGEPSVSEETKQNFINMGMYHILVLSGVHFSIICGIIYYIFKKILSISFFLNYYSNSVLLARISALIFGVFYLEMIFWPIPANRALIMLAISYLLPKRIKKLNILGIVCICFLIIDPNFIYNPSFQLSFLCTAAILLPYGKLLVNVFPILIIPTFSVIGLATNYFALMIFPILLPMIFFINIFKLKFLIFIPDLIVDCILFFSKLNLSPILIKYTFFSRIIFGIGIILVILSDRYKLLLISFVIILALEIGKMI